MGKYQTKATKPTENRHKTGRKMKLEEGSRRIEEERRRNDAGPLSGRP